MTGADTGLRERVEALEKRQGEARGDLVGGRVEPTKDVESVRDSTSEVDVGTALKGSQLDELSEKMYEKLHHEVQEKQAEWQAMQAQGQEDVTKLQHSVDEALSRISMVQEEQQRAAGLASGQDRLQAQIEALQGRALQVEGSLAEAREVSAVQQPRLQHVEEKQMELQKALEENERNDAEVK